MTVEHRTGRAAIHGPGDLSTARHDVRAALHTMLGFADLLEDLDLPADARTTLDGLALAGRELRSAVDTLLEAATDPISDDSPPARAP